MFVRKKRNLPGAISVQVIDKSNGYRVVETIGSASDREEVSRLMELGRRFIARQNKQYSLFPQDQQDDTTTFRFVQTFRNASIGALVPESIFGRLFDEIGFGVIPESLFRDIAITLLAYPTSNLRTVDYVYCYQGKKVLPDRVCRCLDRLNERYSQQAQDVAYQHSRKILNRVNVVFYDMTSLYFEAEDEDDLRKTGCSRDGKFQNPQIMLGLPIGKNSYPIGYSMFEGNTFEGKTLIPVPHCIQKQYNFGKPADVANAAMLSKNNVDAMKRQDPPFIIAARLRNEPKVMQG